MRKRNFRVREQIMQQRIKRIVAENKHIAKGTLPRSESYFDLSEHFSHTITQSTGQLTAQDLRQLITSLPDEMRAGEQQSLYEFLYRSVVLRDREWPIVGRSLWVGGGL